MVINDLDIQRVAILKSKADAPLIVDANAPLTFSVSPQCFQPVPRRRAKVFKRRCVVDHLQLSLGNSGKCSESGGAAAFE